MLMRIIAWTIWAIFLIAFLAYVPIVQHLSEQPFDGTRLDSNEQVALVIVLAITVLIEAMITLLLRYHFLIKALRRGKISLESIKGKIRFVLIHIAIWLITSLIATTGLVLAVVTKDARISYVFFIVYAGLMLFHAPRLAPLKVNRGILKNTD